MRAKTCPWSWPHSHKQQPRVKPQLSITVHHFPERWIFIFPWSALVIKDSLLNTSWKIWFLGCIAASCPLPALPLWAQDPAGFAVHVLCGLVVFRGAAVRDADRPVPLPWGRWRWTVRVDPSGHPSLPTLDYQGIKGYLRKGRTDDPWGPGTVSVQVETNLLIKELLSANCSYQGKARAD